MGWCACWLNVPACLACTSLGRMSSCAGNVSFGVCRPVQWMSSRTCLKLLSQARRVQGHRAAQTMPCAAYRLLPAVNPQAACIDVDR